VSAGSYLNLARRPFENRRLVVRLAILLWFCGGVLVVINAWSFYRYFSGSTDGRDDLVAVRAEIARESEAARILAAELRSFDLETQNEQVAYLNQRIAERTFPWSRLFDHLAEALPRGVRLRSLYPAREEKGGPRRERELHAGERVQLDIEAEAEDGEQMLAFLEALFDHPAFSAPIINSESRVAAAEIVDFDLRVTYAPSAIVAGDAGPPPGAGTESGAEAAGSVGGGTSPGDGGAAR
jgi:Tfp pilus assembly protein PilN